MRKSAYLAGGARLGVGPQWSSVQGGIPGSGRRVSLQERGEDPVGQVGADQGNRNATSVAELTCSDVRSQLNELIDDALDSSARGRLERHISQCNDCGALHHTLEQTVSGLADLEPVRSRSGIRERLKQRLQADSGR